MPDLRDKNLSMDVPFATDNPQRAASAFAHNLALPPQLETTIGRDNKLDYSFLEKGVLCGRAVCKLETSGTNYRGQQGRWSGTGWLIAPNLLLTNHHVLNSIEAAGAASAIFAFERDTEGRERVTRRFRLDPSSLFITHPVVDSTGQPGLDFSVVWIDPLAAAEFGHLQLVRNPGPALEGDLANIIQHPNGGLKRVTLQDNAITRGIESDVVYVRYRADTEPGSSGAPVFFNTWAPFALHHASRDNGDGTSANEGILLTAIAAHLETMVARGVQAAEATAVLSCIQGADPMLGAFGTLGRPQTHAPAVEAVVDAFSGEEHDLDVGFWNIEWFNKHFQQKREAVARIILEMNLDLWGLSETSREATEALRDQLNTFPGVHFECLASAPDAPSSLQNTAVLWNTRTVNVTREAWPAEVEIQLRLDSRDPRATDLEAVDGKIFDRYPALYRFSMLRSEGLQSFNGFLVPLHLKAMSEGSKRRAMASKILTAAVARTTELRGESDWVIGGDYNAELASGDFDALRGSGMVVLSAEDEDAGAFSYAKSPKSLIDHIFVTSDVTAQFGASDFFIVAHDKTVADYVKAISDHRPVVARFQLKRASGETPDFALAGSTAPWLQQKLQQLFGNTPSGDDPQATHGGTLVDRGAESPVSDAPGEFQPEALPDEVHATLQQRKAWMSGLPPAGDGMEFLVSDLQRWTPGQTVRVAFLGGASALHSEIVDACQMIVDSCNLRLDFGRDPATGRFRSWSPQDTSHRAEIRVSFDQIGYFSLVGTDSIDTNIGAPGHAVGGRPGQRSLNFAGFDVQRPADWKGTVRHEFLHALAFHHEHQNLRGPCQTEFRWDDDVGYVPTRNGRGVFIADPAGLRPGIYTYLSGAPNFWSKPKVDFNLRADEDSDLVAGPFDATSVMLYRFPPLFYKSVPSACAPSGDGQALSAGDVAGLQLLYPNSAPAVSALVDRRVELLAAITGGPANASAFLESVMAAEGPASSWGRSTAAALRACLEARG